MTRGLRRDKRGGLAVEFAVVAGLLCLMTCGIVEVGLIWWMKSGLQITASMTARCGAIGASYTGTGIPCTTAAATQAYGVSVAQSWMFASAVTTSDVKLNGASGVVTSCNGFTGPFFSVTVTSEAVPGFMAFGNIRVLSASACFPMAS
jgi:Flp pilus assembly protein TadG